MDLDRIPTPKDLHGAASVAQTLAYVVGLAGVVAGAVLLRQEGEIGLALLVWVLTFAAGALLMIVAFLTNALAALLARSAAMEQDLRVLLGRQRPDAQLPGPGGPYDGGSHPNPW
jgi:hypothetical protein